SRSSLRSSEEQEEQDQARLEAERKLEELKRRRGDAESEEFERMRQKQQEAEAELEELKRKREERKKVLEEEERQRKQEEAERRAKEEQPPARLPGGEEEDEGGDREEESGGGGEEAEGGGQRGRGGTTLQVRRPPRLLPEDRRTGRVPQQVCTEKVTDRPLLHQMCAEAPRLKTASFRLQKREQHGEELSFPHGGQDRQPAGAVHLSRSGGRPTPHRDLAFLYRFQRTFIPKIKQRVLTQIRANVCDSPSPLSRPPPPSRPVRSFVLLTFRRLSTSSNLPLCLCRGRTRSPDPLAPERWTCPWSPTAYDNIKSMWEKGGAFSSAGSGGAQFKEAAVMKTGVAGRINDWLNKTPESSKPPGGRPSQARGRSDNSEAVGMGPVWIPPDLKPVDVTNKRSLWENKGASPSKVEQPDVCFSRSVFAVAAERLGEEAPE
ncbi:unnamed protein product, partial [Tetraodon nigroviridis]